MGILVTGRLSVNWDLAGFDPFGESLAEFFSLVFWSSVTAASWPVAAGQP